MLWNTTEQSGRGFNLAATSALGHVTVALASAAPELDFTLINKLTDEKRSVVFDGAVRSVPVCLSVCLSVYMSVCLCLVVQRGRPFNQLASVLRQLLSRHSSVHHETTGRLSAGVKEIPSGVSLTY